MRLKKLHSNERGMALVTALLILVALTLLAVTAMTNTTINTMIAGNDYKSQQKFYATEGAEELALAAIPDLIAGLDKTCKDQKGNPIYCCNDQNLNPITCDDQNHNPITTLNQLLGYDKNGITPLRYDKNVNGKSGNITPLIYSYLKNQDINQFCNLGGTSGQYMYSVHVEDDEPENTNPCCPKLIDTNNEIYLISAQTDSIKGKTTDLISYTLRRLEIKHDGAVNLIDNNGGRVFIGVGDNAKVDGGNNKDGIVTTDMQANIVLRPTAKVDPNGVVQRSSQLVNPSIKDFHDVMSLLTADTTLRKAGTTVKLGTSNNNNNNDVNVIHDIPENIYLQGNVVITQDLQNKVLIIGDYYDTATKQYHIGLTLNQNVTFEGLILILPAHDVSSAIPIPIGINLQQGAKINGAMVASSLFDSTQLYDPIKSPQTLFGPGLHLELGTNAEINYNYYKIVSTGFERQFAVLKRDYLSH